MASPVPAAAAAPGAPIDDDDDKILARVKEVKAAYDAWCADASAHEAELSATVEIADLPRNKQHKMVALLRGSGFESIRQTGTGHDTLAVSKARPAPPRAIVVGDLPIRVRGAYHAALAFYEDAKPGPHPVSYEVGMTEWSADDRRLLMDALLAKGFTYECKQYIESNPFRFTATFRKDKPVVAAAAPAAADGANPEPGPIVITRSQPDAHFWVQMAGENDHDDRRSFQCDRCQVPMSVSSDCRSYEQMVGMFTTLVCPAWIVHRHNPAVYALRKAAEAAAAAASDESNPNKRQRR